MSVSLPRLLAQDLTERERLQPIAATLNLKLIGASDATITLPDAAPDVAVHDLISIYTQRGFSGIYRVTNVARNYKRQTEISLLHGIDILADSVWQEQIEFSGTIEAFLEELLAQQTHLINGVKPWVLGECEDTGDIKKTINYDRLSTLMEDLIEDGGLYYFVYDQTTFPWTVSLVQRPAGASSEFRLARNVHTASVTYNDADLATRLILSDNHRSKDGDEKITTNKSKILTYDNLAAQAEWGVVIKTADIDTEDDIEAEVYTEADAWAADFLAKRAEPTVQIQIDGDELYGLTGDTWDEISIGRICRVALPAYNRTFEERVISVTYPDLLSKPSHVTVALANALPKFSESITKLQDEMKKVAGGGAGAARNAADPNELETWSQYVSYYGAALDGTGILTLYESGIDMDPVHGVTIHSLTEGVQSLYSYIQVESNRISLVVTGSGQTAGINVQGITNAINQSSVTISADRVNLNGYVTVNGMLDGDYGDYNYLGVTTGRIDDLTSSNITVNTEIAGALFSADEMTVGGRDVETELAYVTNVTADVSASQVTLHFTKGSGAPIQDITFSRGGQASGVSLSAASNIRETQEGSGVWQADTTVSLNGTTATKTLDVTTAVGRGYDLGEAAGYSTGWAAANNQATRSGNVITLYKEGSTDYKRRWTATPGWSGTNPVDLVPGQVFTGAAGRYYLNNRISGNITWNYEEQ